MNIDRHLPNDPLSRPDMRALTPILEDYMVDSSMVQVNHKPTRHQQGCRSSLLDLFITYEPERLVEVDNILNTMSEHEGVICTLLTKVPCKLAKSNMIRNYDLATFSVMQDLIDKNEKLQSLFTDTEPEIIGQKLTQGMNEITDLVVSKKRIQIKNRGVKFWSKTLESERRVLSGLNKQAIRTKDPGDIRLYKHKKNQHTKNITKYQKTKIRENMSRVKSRWGCYKDIVPEEDATPKQVKFKGKLISSPKEIANAYAEFLDNKLEGLRHDITQTNFKAMKIFKARIKRVEDDMSLPPATIKEVKQIIKKMKPSNSRGNSEITGRIIKQVSQYITVAMTHLANCVFKSGTFP